MKKLLSLALLLGGICFSANAQKLKINEVPAAVQTAFTSKHPGAIAKWEKENADYEANFTSNGAEMSAVYNSLGQELETEIEISTSELPETVTYFMATQYAGKKIKEVSKITKADGMILYEVGIQKKDILFNASGMFVAEIKD